MMKPKNSSSQVKNVVFIKTSIYCLIELGAAVLLLRSCGVNILIFQSSSNTNQVTLRGREIDKVTRVRFFSRNRCRVV